MKILTQTMLVALSAIGSSALAASSPVEIQSANGESYVLYLNSEDTFNDVAETAGMLFTENDQEELVFTIRTSAKALSQSDTICKKIRAVARSYEAGIKPAECADINYIVKTMANSSLPKIKSAESALKKAGDRIDHVHPFYFLSCIFTNEELKVCMRNLQGRAWVWKEFLKGIVDSLAEEDARGNVLPYLADFSSKVQVDPAVLRPILEGGRWERFVNTLIEVVPRQGGADRYNM
jgi:hypothetical protein